jgi:16S rRNA (guanine527-N7)-methyltransferase
MVRRVSITFEEVRPALERWKKTLPANAGWAGIETWLRLLCEWNARMDLTAARTPGELVELMLLDAHHVCPDLPRGASVVDVGTGAGAPGLAVALMRPDLVVTLCEPLAKRASFLRTVLGSLERTDVTLTSKRGESLSGEWDVAMSRATLPPAEWLALGAQLVKPGGSVWVLLANAEPPSLPGATLVADSRYEAAEAGAMRRGVRYEIISR